MGNWYEHRDEVMAFAHVLTDAGAFGSGCGEDSRDSLRELLYYLEKPQKWDPEYQRWQELGRPDGEHVTLEALQHAEVA